MFSYTENAVEVSIVTDSESINEDFVGSCVECPSLVISTDEFRALEIESGNFTILITDGSSRQINALSAPLAAAGISIFFLSTYQTDLILVVIALIIGERTAFIQSHRSSA